VIGNMPPTSNSIKQFQTIFGHQPVVLSRSPGRVNLIGEHVDYQGGFVMPIALDRYLEMAARPITEPEIRLWSSNVDRPPLCVPIEGLQPLQGDDSWANYILGVAAQHLGKGSEIVGFEAVIDGDLPVGAGLSSSAALESIASLTIEQLNGLDQSPRERALLSQAAEHQFAGVPCGIMDQLIVNEAVAEHALMIDCESLSLTPVPLPVELSVVIVNSGVRHALADGEYRKRRADCEAASRILGVPSLRHATLPQLIKSRDQLGDRLFRRAHHIVTENVRVKAFAKALNEGDTPSISHLMADSHTSLRDNYEVSCSELDTLVRLASNLRAVGTRMTGGGFGGSTINLVNATQASDFCTAIRAAYLQQNQTSVDAFVIKPVSAAGGQPIDQ
jgi:galactokinase